MGLDGDFVRGMVLNLGFSIWSYRFGNYALDRDGGNIEKAEALRVRGRSDLGLTRLYLFCLGWALGMAYNDVYISRYPGFVL